MCLVKLKIIDETDTVLLTAPAAEEVSLVYHGLYKPGDRIALEVSEPGQFCVVQFEDSMLPAIIYVCKKEINFHIPHGVMNTAYSPKNFSGGCHLIRARIAKPEDLALRRNLAFAPYDEEGDTGYYPHASANVPAKAGSAFAARCAVDGIRENLAHGHWPYTSWSINCDPNAALTIDFGRPVNVDEIRLTIRADFPHDSWWRSATVHFSDDSCEVLTLNQTAAVQSFSVTPRDVTSLTLCELKKADDDSPFPALTQIEVFGTETNDGK